ncbi:RNA polymerase sigma-70 factor [Seonamhaeicola sp. ML3]|uniref:RNA polymerase sigma-70 factor n=1 Tax=Seonamhaeicola sp. ML3 TaxID=2937786 RepID=UPI00200BAE51|nr:RNA polymerase sigma-70 factor [Seonamhaeicola sp. ML3]
MDSKDVFLEIRKKNHSAFKEVFQKYYFDLVLYANQYLFDKGLSEDVVQDVYIRLWEGAESIEIKTSLKAYLYTMVRNRCFNKLKTLKITYTSDEVILDYANKNVQTPYLLENNNKQILHQRILESVEDLPNKMKLIVKLRFVNNYKYKEIANELNISVNTVKTQLKRAKVKLAQFVIFSVIFILTINLL